MKTKLMTMAVGLLMALPAMAQQFDAPVGWASVEGGTTGSGNRNPVVVETVEQLKKVLKGDVPRTIYIKGELKFDKMLSIGDFKNKTIYGLTGSALVNNTHIDQQCKNDTMPKVKSGILTLKRCSNVILRNLTFKGPGAYDVDGRDNLFITESDHMWIDHCDFQDAIDGCLDISNGSDLISVTWCRFRYLIAPWAGGSGGSDDHRFPNLVGSSDKKDSDAGKLRVTYACCWWDQGCVRRMPRVRFGQVHVVNCYFSSTVAGDCIGVGYRANIYAEKNAFNKMKNPWKLYATKKPFTDYHITMIGNAGAQDERKGQGEDQFFKPEEHYEIPTIAAMMVPMVVGNETEGAGATMSIELNQ